MQLMGHSRLTARIDVLASKALFQVGTRDPAVRHRRKDSSSFARRKGRARSLGLWNRSILRPIKSCGISCSDRCGECGSYAAYRTQDLSCLSRISADGLTASRPFRASGRGCFAWGVPRTIAFHPNAHGRALYDSFEFHSAARGASQAVLVARAIFRRAKISGIKTHDAHAGSAHGVRERALPQHGRVLGARHGHIHDFGRHLHAGLRFLRGAER